jgi:hypothetical protein
MKSTRLYSRFSLSLIANGLNDVREASFHERNKFQVFG